MTGSDDGLAPDHVVIDLIEYPFALLPALREVMHHVPYRNLSVEMNPPRRPGQWRVTLRRARRATHGRRVKMSATGHADGTVSVEIVYSRRIEAFRGLGRLLAVAASLRRHPDGNVIAMLNVTEEAQFDSVGVMVDCSRCAVLTCASIRWLLRVSALCGLNTLQLYTEDTYPLPGEPFFGYFRGRFSESELRETDAYAAMLGIEVFPCIQTLGHMGQALQWPRFANVRDTHEVLLCGADETYQLIERMVRSASAPFRSRRIHIGMDEAHGLSEGRYRQVFGARDSTLVFLDHLKLVHDVCRRLGRRCMIWSDMLFCLAAKNTSLNSYYDLHNAGIGAQQMLATLFRPSEAASGKSGRAAGGDRRSERHRRPPPAPIPMPSGSAAAEPSSPSSLGSFKSVTSSAQVAAAAAAAAATNPNPSAARRPSITSVSSATSHTSMEMDGAEAESDEESDASDGAGPPDMDLVYWDYYHTDESVYAHKIQQHRDLGMEPWVAGGIWTWNRLYPALPFTFKASEGCLRACKAARVRNVFVTVWGDDGNECDMLAAAPGLFFFGEHAYTPAGSELDEMLMHAKFTGVCGGRWEDFVFASQIDMIPASTIPVDTKTHFPPNLSKWLLWQDTAYSILTPQTDAYALEPYYAHVAAYLAHVSMSPGHVMNYPFNMRLRFPALIAATLALKVRLREHLATLYRAGDRAGIVAEALDPRTGRLFQLRVLVEALWHEHRDAIWIASNKPFGLEIIELRYGGLRARLETLTTRLLRWVAAGADPVPLATLEQSLAVASAAEPRSPDFVSPVSDDPAAVPAPAGPYHGLVQAPTDEAWRAVHSSLERLVRSTVDGGLGMFESSASVDELAADTHTIWEHVGPALVLDFARAYTPARALGTG